MNYLFKKGKKEESNKRRKMFEKLLFDLNRISKFDREIREIFNIIEPIIECYSSPQYMNTYQLDNITYEKIFSLLATIRTDKTCIENLKNIITKQ